MFQYDNKSKTLFFDVKGRIKILPIILSLGVFLTIFQQYVIFNKTQKTTDVSPRCNYAFPPTTIPETTIKRHRDRNTDFKDALETLAEIDLTSEEIKLMNAYLVKGSLLESLTPSSPIKAQRQEQPSIDNQPFKEDYNIHSFEEINLNRLRTLEKTCQEISRDPKDSFRALKLREYAELASQKIRHKISDFENYFNLHETSDSITYYQSRRFYNWRKSDHWLMCLPPKHGCSNWQRALIASERNVSVDEVAHNYQLYDILGNFKNEFPDPGTWDTDEAYTEKYSAVLMKTLSELNSNKKVKIMLTRHPIERLYSAWADKFFMHEAKKSFHDKYLPLIGKKYDHLKTESYACSFPDFIRYWIDSTNQWGQKRFDNHWKSQEYGCLPCNHKFDYIVKLETSNYDNPALMKILYPNAKTVEMPKKYKQHAPWTSQENDDSTKWLPQEMIEELRQIFKWELKMFDYEY